MDTNKIIQEMNNILAEKKMSYTEIYETLVAKGIVLPNSERDFKKIYEVALDNELIERTKIKSWNKKKGKLPRYFTKSQLVSIFEVVDRPKDAIACFMALMCGLRINEVCNLEIKDIDFDNYKVLIKDSKNTNRKRDNYGVDRYVNFHPSIVGIIKRWLEVIGDTSKWFLPSDKSPDTHLRPKSLNERFRVYLKKANLLQIEYRIETKQKVNGKMIDKILHKHRYTFHCFRHTMACIIYNKTGDIFAVNRFLGHKQLDTTMVYAKITDTKMKRIVEDIFTPNLNNETLSPNHQSIKTSPQQQRISANADPIQFLKLQYANGEIDEDEFLRRIKTLQSLENKQNNN